MNSVIFTDNWRWLNSTGNDFVFIKFAIVNAVTGKLENYALKCEFHGNSMSLKLKLNDYLGDLKENRGSRERENRDERVL